MSDRDTMADSLFTSYTLMVILYKLFIFIKCVRVKTKINMHTINEACCFRIIYLKLAEDSQVSLI